MTEKIMCGQKLKYRVLFLIIGILFTAGISINAQQMKKNNQKESKGPGWNQVVRVSPKASIEETVGLTDVTISYSRPGVKGRKIWGGLVPYGKVWRAGANEATKITFSKAVSINGKKLSAGSYGFFIIPTTKNWTIIFNKVADQWGAFTYNEAEDALRLHVTPQQSTFHEWLTYTFENMKVDANGKPNSAVVYMKWEKVKLPFTIEADGK